MSKEVEQAIAESKDFSNSAFDTAQADLSIEISKRDKAFFLTKPFRRKTQDAVIEAANEKLTAAQRKTRTLSVIENLDYQKPRLPEEGWVINFTVRGNRLHIREDVWYVEYEIAETIESVRNVRYIGSINDERIPEEDAKILFEMYQSTVSEIAVKADAISGNKTMQA